MLLSESKEFIFFHLYKTAGTSLRHVLKPYCGLNESKHYNVNGYLTNADKDIYEKYFTFGFVRNPWDWQVSLYHYMLKSKLGLDGELPHYVKSNHAPYKEYYNETTQKMIADAYHKDVSYFNYTF